MVGIYAPLPCKPARASLAGCPQQTAPAQRGEAPRPPTLGFPPWHKGGLSGGIRSTRRGASGSKDKAEGHLSRQLGHLPSGHDQPRCRDFCRMLGGRYGFDAGGHVLRRGLDFTPNHPKHAEQSIRRRDSWCCLSYHPSCPVQLARMLGPPRQLALSS